MIWTSMQFFVTTVTYPEVFMDTAMIPQRYRSCMRIIPQ